MGWSYDATSTTALNKVRRRIGDTNTNDQLLTDEEIGDFLTEYSDDIYCAGAASCEAICAKLARDTTHSLNSASNSRDQKFDHYEKLAIKLWGKAQSTATSYVGGTSIGEEEDFKADEDLKQLNFEIAKDDRK